jgi:DNA-3-methyladenine glycosylase I
LNNLLQGKDGLMRCAWCGQDPLYQKYHDEEWGNPALDDRSQFEFLVLESAQAGLSWLTVLRKREAYRESYAGFNPETAAGWGEKEIAQLLGNPGIIRNRRKIEASISNARIFLDISSRYGSFAGWLLSFSDDRIQVNNRNSLKEIPVTDSVAENIAREGRSMGMKFFGAIIVYSHLQATGIVDDHLNGCWRRRQDS